MNEYECYCEPQEGEPWDWFNTEMRHSKKQRKCCECRDTIQVGELYEYTVGNLAGDVMTFVTCAFCADEHARVSNASEYCIAKGELACAVVAEIRGDL